MYVSCEGLMSYPGCIPAWLLILSGIGSVTLAGVSSWKMDRNYIQVSPVFPFESRGLFFMDKACIKLFLCLNNAIMQMQVLPLATGKTECLENDQLFIVVAYHCIKALKRST